MKVIETYKQRELEVQVCKSSSNRFYVMLFGDVATGLSKPYRSQSEASREAKRVFDKHKR